MAKADKPKTLKATVTNLEMTGRPKHLPALPVNIHATLLKTHEMPLHFYRYLQWRVGREWHWVHRLRMEDAELEKIVRDKRTEIWVLSVDGSPAGFFELFHADPTTVNLAYFGVMDHARGRGLGKWMLGQALSAAWQGSTTLVTVSTNTLDHPHALRLYQRMGFSPRSQNEAIIRPLSEPELLKLIQAL